MTGILINLKSSTDECLLCEFSYLCHCFIVLFILLKLVHVFYQLKHLVETLAHADHFKPAEPHKPMLIVWGAAQEMSKCHCVADNSLLVAANAALAFWRPPCVNTLFHVLKPLSRHHQASSSCLAAKLQDLGMQRVNTQEDHEQYTNHPLRREEFCLEFFMCLRQPSNPGVLLIRLCFGTILQRHILVSLLIASIGYVLERKQPLQLPLQWLEEWMLGPRPAFSLLDPASKH